MREERYTEYPTYPCKVLNDEVILTLNYLALPDVNYRVRSDFDCDHKHMCGVGKHSSPGNWSFDWSKCQCPYQDPTYEI